MNAENEFVRSLKKRFPVRTPVVVGIGDDGAVLACGDQPVVVVTDLLLDTVHFDLKVTSPHLAGRKAVAVNLSDLAAMGCRPTAAFVSIAVPITTPSAATATGTEFLNHLYAGIEELTDQYRFTLAGGDTNAWHGPFAINVCLTGTPFGKAPLLRSGARAGDVLFVSGYLGGSLARNRHLLFLPRLDLSEWLALNVDCHALMDLSDGLSTDLLRMMEASGVSAVLEADQIPIHDDVNSEWSPDRRLTAALNDGEDFELLLAVSATDAEILPARARAAGFTLFRVGRVCSDSESLIRYPDGQSVPLQSSGWQHQWQSEDYQAPGPGNNWSRTL